MRAVALLTALAALACAPAESAPATRWVEHAECRRGAALTFEARGVRCDFRELYDNFGTSVYCVGYDFREQHYSAPRGEICTTWFTQELR